MANGDSVESRDSHVDAHSKPQEGTSGAGKQSAGSEVRSLIALVREELDLERFQKSFDLTVVPPSEVSLRTLDSRTRELEIAVMVLGFFVFILLMARR